MSAATSRSSYAQSLRVIGQFLETNQPEAFDLQLIDGEFVVRLHDQRPPPPKFTWTKIQEAIRAALGLGQKEAEQPREHHYAAEKVQEMDQQAQSRRQNPEGTPDFYRLSQTLRTVGAYVDHTDFRLLDLRREGQRLVLRLEEGNGRSRVEEHAVSSFFHYFLQLYPRRSKEPTPTDQGESQQT